MKEAIKKWWLNIKPIKYITLKQKYNQLDTKYQALLEAEIYSLSINLVKCKMLGR